MAMKATQFRAQLFQVLASVLDEGKVVDIELSGRLVELRAKPPLGPKLSRLVARDPIAIPDDDLLSAGWDEQAWLRTWDEHLGTSPLASQRAKRKARRR